jgi:hypothetical protein
MFCPAAGTNDAAEQQSHDAAEQRSKAANSGGERSGGLILFIVGIVMWSLRCLQTYDACLIRGVR